jgi:hypothetical protein
MTDVADHTIRDVSDILGVIFVNGKNILLSNI